MSSLKRALERSKAAWEAVGTPERARAVLRDDKRGIISNVSLATTTIDSINLLDLIGGKWRAIVPNVKYEPVGTLPVVGDFVVHVRSTGAVCDAPPDHKPALVTALHEDDDGIMNCLADDVFWAFAYFGNGDFRVLKRKVPKKAKDAGWPRYYVDDDDHALVMRSAAMRDGTYYSSTATDASNGWWGDCKPEDNGFKPVTPHQFAEWLYDHGHTEAAYKIEPMWEPEGTMPQIGDHVGHPDNPSPLDFHSVKEIVIGAHSANRWTVADDEGAWHGFGFDNKGFRILRRSRARRDAIAEIEGKLKALGEIK